MVQSNFGSASGSGNQIPVFNTHLSGRLVSLKDHKHSFPVMNAPSMDDFKIDSPFLKTASENTDHGVKGSIVKRICLSKEESQAKEKIDHTCKLVDYYLSLKNFKRTEGQERGSRKGFWECIECNKVYTRKLSL